MARYLACLVLIWLVAMLQLSPGCSREAADIVNATNDFIAAFPDTSPRHRPIAIVYYTFVNPDRWRVIVPGQMRDLIQFKILKRTSTLDLVFSVDRGPGAEQLVSDLKQTLKHILGQFYTSITKLTILYENLYEYSGMKIWHERAVADPHKIYLYFHGKGMFFRHDVPSTVRVPDEVILSKYIIKPWRHMLDMFLQRSDLMKAGLMCNADSLVYMNFIWARGSYLAQCTPPKRPEHDPPIMEDRYYYEFYISTDCPKVNVVPACHSMVNDVPDLNWDRQDFYHGDFVGKFINLITDDAKAKARVKYDMPPEEAKKAAFKGRPSN